MQSGPYLFDLATPKPTTREVADAVRTGGVDALPDAVRKADAVKYQDVRCRSALNEVKGMPFRWTLNPYRGCTHGCHYCYARRYQTQFSLGSDDEFASIIFVKTNFIQVLRRELDSPSWDREYVAVGTATDCYQPIEGHYKLTRQTLETLNEHRTPVGVVTKGPMIVRDKDVLAEMSRTAGCTVYVSVPTVDEDIWAQLEPGTAHPFQRLRAVRELAAAGIRVGALMSPIVPGLSSRWSLLERTVQAIADHGASFLGYNVMHLEGGTREHFIRWLTATHPELLERYQRLYARKYASGDYCARLSATMEELRAKYNLGGRGTFMREAAPMALAAPEPTQQPLNWFGSAPGRRPPHSMSTSATTGK